MPAPLPQEAAGQDPAGWPKVNRFLQSMRRWRQRARRESLSACLESILDETSYDAWLSQTPRGTQRQANVRRLLRLTRQFDQFQRQGLFRFLRFVQAQRIAGLDAEPASPTRTEAIRLLSIHQSKGLEFPVVVVADLAKPFNVRDLSSRVILDETFGLCSLVQPPQATQRYPSLPHWLARRRQCRELLGEELRLFYVATTRACDLLILVGTANQSSIEQRWQPGPIDPIPLPRLLSAQSCLDWLGAWLPAATGHSTWIGSGHCPWLRWNVAPNRSVIPSAEAATPSLHASKVPTAVSCLSSPQLERLAWRYPHPWAISTPAKASVSTLRRRSLELHDEAWPMIPMVNSSGDGMSGADRGTAHHRFLERLPLDQPLDQKSLQAQAEALGNTGILTAAEIAVLDYEAIAAFWLSAVGTSIRQESASVQRELTFTARFSLAELRALDLLNQADPESTPALEAEWLVVQGVVDLAVVRPSEIWILDFKTDRISSTDLAGKVEAYRPQLRLYARALARIYRRPVRNRWLHFLPLRQTLTIDEESARTIKTGSTSQGMTV
jgi:ATP-dependent helicase/nuclease subunit A